jgi:F-type H+-transporting ATPase subunit epsilon
MTLKVNVVASDKRIWNGDASMVIAPSVGGEIGLLTGHQPVMTALKAGDVRISFEVNGKTDIVEIEVTGGFVSLYDDVVSVIADNATIK